MWQHSTYICKLHYSLIDMKCISLWHHSTYLCEITQHYLYQWVSSISFIWHCFSTPFNYMTLQLNIATSLFEIFWNNMFSCVSLHHHFLKMWLRVAPFLLMSQLNDDNTTMNKSNLTLWPFITYSTINIKETTNNNLSIFQIFFLLFQVKMI